MEGVDDITENYRYKVGEKEYDLIEYPWDVLIILDACRYDMFKEIYRGEVQKAISPATCTPEFLEKVFSWRRITGTVYVSGNAYINSKGIPLPEASGYQFNAVDNIESIIDVWETGWSEKLGTVHPEEMNKHAMVSLDVHPDKRHIIHYVQPHEPYLYFGGGIGGAGYATTNNSLLWKGKISRVLNRFLPNETVWKWAYRFGQLPPRGKGMLWIENGREGLIRAYKEDIKLVLRYVAQLYKRYPHKKFLITADHGELLGEYKRYGHTAVKKRYQQLVEVPWVELC